MDADDFIEFPDEGVKDTRNVGRIRTGEVCRTEGSTGSPCALENEAPAAFQLSLLVKNFAQ